jgi:hypothetical protein
MQSLFDAAPGIPQISQWVWLIIVGVLLLLLLGYRIGSRITGFGPYVVKETETLEFDDLRKDAEPARRLTTTQKQIGRTFWDWITVLTISAVIAGIGLIFTSSQAEKQQAKDAVVQAYFDQMTQMMLDDKNHLLESEPDSAERVAARVQTVTALKRLDGEHNKIVPLFLKDLKESGLVNFGLPYDQGEETLLRLDITP